MAPRRLVSKRKMIRNPFTLTKLKHMSLDGTAFKKPENMDLKKKALPTADTTLCVETIWYPMPRAMKNPDAKAAVCEDLNMARKESKAKHQELGALMSAGTVIPSDGLG